MTHKEYIYFLNHISKRVGNLNNYNSFINFENDWLNYFKKIYTQYSNNNLPPRIFIAESAPNGIYPLNTNYIFHQNTLNNKISCKRDMYLYRYFRGVFINSTPKSTQHFSKRAALIELSKENILILDLLPTHGIKLAPSERDYIKNNLLNLVDFKRINNLNSPYQKVNYAFSVPPKLYSQNMCAKYLNSKFTEFGNMNTGQGHAPSIRAISQIVQNGF